MLTDVLIAVRGLRRQPGFAAAAVVTLALAMAGNTAIVSIVVGVLVRPLPYPDPDRLVQISEFVPGGVRALPGDDWVTNLAVQAWQEHATTIGPLAHFGGGSATVGTDSRRRLQRGNVAPNFFEVLGLQPRLGRFFHDEDAEPTAAVVVISSELWNEQFGGDESVLGRTIEIDERAHTIVGIAPPGLTVPTRDTRIWTPVRLAPVQASGRDARVLPTRAIARLRERYSTGHAAAEGTAIARATPRPLGAELLLGKGGAVEIRVRTLHEESTRSVRPALLVLVGALGILLLLACANVANLFLSRGVARQRELALRMTLGATRPRIAQFLVCEALVVTTAAGAVGSVIAWALLTALPAAAPATFPRLDSVQFDWLSGLAALAVSLLATVAVAVLPALRAGRPAALAALRVGVSIANAESKSARRALLVVEVALAVLLAVGATLLARSFVNLTNTDVGFDAREVLTARIYLPEASRGQALTEGFLGELLPRLRGLPGVHAVGASNMAPLGSSTYYAGFIVQRLGRERVTARVLSYVVTPGYAEAIGLRLRSGRLLDERDLASGAQSMVVNQTFVRTFLNDIDPVGLRLPSSIVTDAVDTSEIVGVVDDVRRNGYAHPVEPEVYITTAHGAAIRREVNLVLKTSGDDPLQYADAVRHAVADIDGRAALDALAPLEHQLRASVAQPRLTMNALLALAVLALGMAGVGLYGALSYDVSLRRREIGVRSALGAPRRSIVAMIVREAMMVAFAGSMVGGAAAMALTRVLQSQLHGVDPVDPPSLVTALALTLIVACAACVLPTLRATQVSPALTLRAE